MNIVEKLIGPLPVGDVDGMRRLSSELRHHAAEIRRHADRIAGQPHSMVFSGPAADGFREFVGHERDHVAAIARELDDQALALDREAQETAQAQRTWHRRADAVHREISRVEHAGARAVDKLDDIRKSIF